MLKVSNHRHTEFFKESLERKTAFHKNDKMFPGSKRKKFTSVQNKISENFGVIHGV